MVNGLYLNVFFFQLRRLDQSALLYIHPHTHRLEINEFTNCSNPLTSTHKEVVCFRFSSLFMLLLNFYFSSNSQKRKHSNRIKLQPDRLNLPWIDMVRAEAGRAAFPLCALRSVWHWRLSDCLMMRLPGLQSGNASSNWERIVILVTTRSL